MALKVLEKSLNFTLPDMYEPWQTHNGKYRLKKVIEKTNEKASLRSTMHAVNVRWDLFSERGWNGLLLEHWILNCEHGFHDSNCLITKRNSMPSYY